MELQLSIMLFSALLFHGLPATADVTDGAGVPGGESCAGERSVGVTVN